MRIHLLFCTMMFFAPIWIMGCQYDPDAHTYVTTEPAESDVVGTYQFERQYVDQSTTVPGHPTIILLADHSCEITDFPEWTEGAGIGTWKLAGSHSAKGTWSLNVVGGLGDGSGNVKKVYGINFGNTAGMTNARLTLSNGKRGLCFGYGDPDGGNSMTFDKLK